MTSSNDIGQSAGDATRAAKAAFVAASPDKLRALIAAQPGIDDVELLSFDLVTEGAGASNGIVLFSAALTRDGQHEVCDLVLRYMPGVQLLRQKSYADEFATVAAVKRIGLPVPAPLWLDADGSTLGFPGYVMERVDGRSPDAAMYESGLLAEASPEDRKAMMLAAAEFHGTLRLAAIGPADVPHLVHRGVGDTAVQRELNWWLAEARLAAPADDPKLNYLERLHGWMIDHEPVLRPPTLSHGDAQIANIMFKDGRLAAVVDWELAYLGHNEADLALILFLTDAHKAQRPDIEGTPTAAEYVEAYERAAGGPVEHLEYFTVFNLVKVLSIYLMLGSKMPNLDAVWDYHTSLVERAVEAARGRAAD